jgi:hypothetical protein
MFNVFIYNLLTIRKGDLLEVEKEKFQVDARHCLFIFFLLFNTKCDLCEVGNLMILMVPRPRNKFLASFLRTEIILVEFEKTIIHGVA